MPSAWRSTARAIGSVGSSQCECSPTSCSRPNACSMSNHSTNSGCFSSSSRFSMSTHDPTISSPRRFSERDTASMRPRSLVDRSSASASSFFASALASADIGFFRSSSAPISSSAAWARPSISGRQSVSMVWPEPAFCSARASTCCRTRDRKFSASPSGWPACTRRVQPGPGSAIAARSTCCSSFWPFSSSPRRSPMRSDRPRPRRRSASGPRIQRRSSAVSSAVR